MIPIQRVAQIFGVVFILVALLGFVTPGGLSMEADLHEAPHLLGLFPVNLLHNLVHLAFGVWGLLASRSFATAKQYAQIGGVIYLVLAVLGLVAPTTFGLIPIGGHDIWLHAVLGIALAYFGFTARDTAGRPATRTA
jgi:hypothetical protein